MAAAATGFAVEGEEEEEEDDDGDGTGSIVARMGWMSVGMSIGSTTRSLVAACRQRCVPVPVVLVAVAVVIALVLVAVSRQSQLCRNQK